MYYFNLSMYNIDLKQFPFLTNWFTNLFQLIPDSVKLIKIYQRLEIHSPPFPLKHFDILLRVKVEEKNFKKKYIRNLC